mgnify:CR=1 FL=1
MSTVPVPPHRWSKQFYRLCLSSLLFFCSFNLIISELPSWLTDLGGREHMGLIIPLFTLTALIARPISGHLADRIGRIPVVLFGVSVSMVCALIYPWMLTLTGFFLIRLMHGLSTGFAPTGTTALLADILPAGRRGEGLGILGLSGSLGMALGPWMGSTVALHFGTTAMFFTSGLVALTSLVLFLGMKETLREPRSFQWKLLLVPRDGLVEPRVWKPALATFLCLFPFGAVLTLAPDLSMQAGLSNKGTFFLYYVLTSVLVRFPAGRYSDRMGRAVTMLIGSLLLALAMAVIAMATTREMVLAGAVLTGLASGINSPAIFAWTADLSLEAHRAKAMATTFIALELGIGMGGLISGYTYTMGGTGMAAAFWVSSAVAACCSIFLAVHLLRSRKAAALRDLRP